MVISGYLRGYLGVILGMVNIFIQILEVWALLAKLAAGVGVEEEQRFNFGHSADYPRPRQRAKKEL